MTDNTGMETFTTTTDDTRVLCSECNIWHHEDDVMTDEASGEAYCEACAMAIADEEFAAAMSADPMTDAEWRAILAEEDANYRGDPDFDF